MSGLETAIPYLYGLLLTYFKIIVLVQQSRVFRKITFITFVLKSSLYANFRGVRKGLKNWNSWTFLSF